MPSTSLFNVEKEPKLVQAKPIKALDSKIVLEYARCHDKFFTIYSVFKLTFIPTFNLYEFSHPDTLFSFQQKYNSTKVNRKEFLFHWVAHLSRLNVSGEAERTAIIVSFIDTESLIQKPRTFLTDCLIPLSGSLLLGLKSVSHKEKG